jgi:hypothetical protein
MSTCTQCVLMTRYYRRLRRDENRRESNENCHNFSNSHTINKLGTLDPVLECEDCGLRIKENVGHTK